MGGNGIKAAERIARELEQQIFASKWEAGHFLGREDDMARESGASRAIFREAIAIVELEGLIECRRGQRGGLFVGSPAREARTSMMRNYLVLASSSIDQVRRHRAWLDQVQCAAVAENIQPGGCDELREIFRMPDDHSPASMVRHSSAMFDKMTELANFPALDVFSTAVVQANIELLVWHGASEADVGELAKRTGGLREQIMDAIIAFDARAIAQLQADIDQIYQSISARFHEPPHDVDTAVERLSLLWRKYPLHASRRAKKPQAVARLIASRMAHDGPGRKIGSEQELMLQFGVSGGVVREAVRTLERYGLVRSRRGNDGGLFSQPRDPGAIAGIIGRHLASAYAAAPRDYEVMSIQTGLAAATAAAERVRAGEAPSLVAPPDAPHEILRWLAAAAADPTLEVMTSANLVAAPPVTAPDPSFFDRRQRLLAAVAAGDVGLSRRNFMDLARRDLFPEANSAFPSLAHGLCVGS